MSKKRTSGYQSYGSTKGDWKYAVSLIFALLGGLFGGLFLGDWFASFGGLVAITLLVGSGLFSAVMFALKMRKVKMRKGLDIGGVFFFGLFSLMMFFNLDWMARSTVLAQVTFLRDGVDIPLLLVNILLCAAVAVGVKMLFSDSADRWAWIPAVLITALFVFPWVSNLIKVVNVVADSTVTDVAVTKVIDNYKEERFIPTGRYLTERYPIYYIIVTESDLSAQGMRFKVGWERYLYTDPGDQVKLLLHPGALGMPWLEVTALDE